MSLVSRCLKAINGSGGKSKIIPEPTITKQTFSIPTVRFDSSRVTDAVKADLWKNITMIKEFDETNFDQVYEAALRSISAGRNLGLLTKAIQEMGITGMTKSRAGEISLRLNNKATAIIQAQRQTSLGIKYAIWLYSGAPCWSDFNDPSPHDKQRDAAHKAANGQRYEVAKGMLLNGKWTSPGRKDGCKCVFKPVMPGRD